jgi:hypothetical protein
MADCSNESEGSQTIRNNLGFREGEQEDEWNMEHNGTSWEHWNAA